MAHILEYLRDPKKLETPIAGWSPNSVDWPFNNRHACMVDCRLPQICLFDGNCRCIETESVCASLRPRPPVSVSHNFTDPIQTAISLNISEIMLEQASYFWKKLDAQSYKDLPFTFIADNDSPQIASAKVGREGEVSTFIAMNSIPDSVRAITKSKDVSRQSAMDMVLMPFAHGLVC